MSTTKRVFNADAIQLNWTTDNTANAGEITYNGTTIYIGSAIAAPTMSVDLLISSSAAVDSNQYLLNSVDINTAGTLTNVAYENQANKFAANQEITGSVFVTGSLRLASVLSGSITPVAGDVIYSGSVHYGWNGSSWNAFY